MVRADAPLIDAFEGTAGCQPEVWVKQRIDPRHWR